MGKQKPAVQIPPEELVKLGETAVSAAKDFEGQGPNLESAIGMLFVGRLYGWKVLYLIHSRRTVDKYAEILGIGDVQSFFPAETELSRKSVGYKIAQTVGNFWKAVKGEYKDKDARSPLFE